MDAINKASALPVYYQIAQRIKQYIEERALKDGDLIPSERELCETFAVSRMTVRQAIDMLVDEEILERQRGRGTFVTSPKFSQSLTVLTSFTLDTVTRGMVPTSKVVFCGVVPAAPQVAERLQIKPGDDVVQVARVRYADGEPHAYECSNLLCEMASPLLDIDLTNRSLYRTLNEVCGLHLVKARELIEAKLCPPEIGGFIKVPPQALTFFIRRITFNEAGRAVEYVESHYRTDKFRFEVELTLGNGK